MDENKLKSFEGMPVTGNVDWMTLKLNSHDIYDNVSFCKACIDFTR